MDWRPQTKWKVAREIINSLYVFVPPLSFSKQVFEAPEKFMLQLQDIKFRLATIAKICLSNI